MKKKILLFSLLIYAISVVASTAFSCVTPPTEVVREKDVCYFKIHGKPNAPSGPPQQGLAEFIYKNLSGKDQRVTLTVKSSLQKIEEVILEIAKDAPPHTDYIIAWCGESVEFAVKVETLGEPPQIYTIGTDFIYVPPQ
jgi:hypothetical protein